MSEIPTKIEKMGSTSSLTPWKHPELGEEMVGSGSGRKKARRFIVGKLVPAGVSNRY